jgi:biotin carboxyl carrier protein
MRRYRALVDGEELTVSVEEETRDALRVSVAGSVHRVDIAEVVPGWYSLVLDGQCYDLGVRSRGARWTLIVGGETYVVEIGGAGPTSRIGRDSHARRAGDVRAPMPGLVVDVRVTDGAQVTEDEPLIIMEAMKMQMEIRAPYAGTIRRVHVASGQEVAEGQALATLE